MSGPGTPSPFDAGAVEVETRAALWLEQRHHGDWTEQDEAAFDVWLTQSVAHRIAYLRLERAWRYADRLSALRTPPRETPKSATRGWPILKGAAAVGAILFLLGTGTAYFSGPKSREHVYATGIGGDERLTLADGSQIELNTDTRLRFSDAGRQRKVILEKGEAYFQVTHDAKRPFVVIANGRRLIDLGTKFLVRQDARELQVTVFEGRVQYDPVVGRANGGMALLTPGDVLLATSDSQSIMRKDSRTALKELGWRHGVVTLDNATLADAAAEFNRYNTRKLVVADPVVARLKIIGTFQANNISAFVSVAQDIFGLHVENRGAEIVISRRMDGNRQP